MTSRLGASLGVYCAFVALLFPVRADELTGPCSALDQQDPAVRKAAADEDQGLYERAVRDYREALQKSPQPRSAITGLGRSLAYLGRCPEAEAAFDKLPAADFPDRDALLGACHFRLREFGQATAALEKAVSRNARDKQTRILLARSYAGAGRYADAVGSLWRDDVLRRESSSYAQAWLKALPKR